MAELKVNTGEIAVVAGEIRSINEEIRSDFDSVQTAINRLNGAWEGPAAKNALNKFNSIKSGCEEPRYAVIGNYVRFLLQQVGDGYSQTEEKVQSLADLFK